MRLVIAFVFAAAVAALDLTAEEPPQRSGPYQVRLMLPRAGVYAGEETEISWMWAAPTSRCPSRRSRTCRKWRRASR